MSNKIWGVTEALVETSMFELHKLSIKPWHQCSTHVHRFKHNTFYVLSGQLFIDVDMLVRAVTLEVGHVFTVKPGQWHRFRTGKKGCVCLEMYYTEPLSEDINRLNTGGPVVPHD